MRPTRLRPLARRRVSPAGVGPELHQTLYIGSRRRSKRLLGMLLEQGGFAYGITIHMPSTASFTDARAIVGSLLTDYSGQRTWASDTHRGRFYPMPLPAAVPDSDAESTRIWNWREEVQTLETTNALASADVDVGKEKEAFSHGPLASDHDVPHTPDVAYDTPGTHATHRLRTRELWSQSLVPPSSAVRHVTWTATKPQLTTDQPNPGHSPRLYLENPQQSKTQFKPDSPVVS
ncbi:hypothetical protein DFH06DRAFT_1308803 [Mycena polygramma]|nr:hypothetical protein DFH06DRAFT_1308803 [Mycena polygramma]